MPATADVFSLSEALVNDLVQLLPVAASMVGIPGHDYAWDDYSTAGSERLESLLRTWQDKLHDLPPAENPWERLAKEIIQDHLRKELDIQRHQDHLLELNTIESPFQHIRQVFDVMDKRGPAAWENIATRLETIEQATWSYQARLESARRIRKVVARRQVLAAIEQGRVNAGERSSFNDLVAACPDALKPRLERAATHARQTYGQLADYLERAYLADAAPEDAVGRERYERCAFRFLGTRLDADEAYHWGWDELHRIEAEIGRLSKQVDPGRTTGDLVEWLRTDASQAAPNHAEFVELMLARQQQAMQDLEGTHFDIPASIRPITVNIAPPGGPLGAYYIPPTEDFSRAGSIWYSLGDHQQVALFDQISTAYHEGFPGHHLQCGIQVTLADKLSRLHRLFVWYPGYGEGWALYTERLMHELGYFEKPEYELGMWFCQMMRACRVVVDIGCHLKLRIPQAESFHPGETWNYHLAVQFMHERGGMAKDRSISEVTRYLGWPGQAICYKLGERAILQLRDDLKARQGGNFNLKAFHHQVLDGGAMGLDLLRERVLSV